MKLLHARVGETLYVYDSSTEAEVKELIEKELAKREVSVTWPDGSKEFIRDEVCLDPSKSGSEAYTWHKDGNRVKYARCRISVSAAGKIVDRKVLRFVYLAF